LVPVSTRGGKPANVLTGVRSMGGGGVRTGRVQVGLGAMGGPASRAGQGGGARIGRGPTNGTHVRQFSLKNIFKDFRIYLSFFSL